MNMNIDWDYGLFPGATPNSVPFQLFDPEANIYYDFPLMAPSSRSFNVNLVHSEDDIKQAPKVEKTPIIVDLDQFQKLEKVFFEKKYISLLDEEELACETGLKVEEVKAWFEYRRMEQNSGGASKDDIEESDGIDSENENAPISYTPRQLEVLESLFLRTWYPDVFTLERTAVQTGLTEAQIKDWFEKRREKARKEDLDAEKTRYRSTVREVDHWFQNRRQEEERRLRDLTIRSKQAAEAYWNLQESAWPEGFRSMNQPSMSSSQGASFHIPQMFPAMWNGQQASSLYTPYGFMGMPQANSSDSTDNNSTVTQTLPILTAKQLGILEKKFKETKFLSLIDQQNVAFDTDLSLMQVKLWFENRRVVEKQRMREEEQSELENQESSERTENKTSVYTSQQLEVLEKRYAEAKYLYQAEYVTLAAKLGVTKEEVELWFENRRNKSKEEELVRQEIPDSTSTETEEKKKSTSCGCFGAFSRYVKSKFTRKSKDVAK